MVSVAFSRHAYAHLPGRQERRYASLWTCARGPAALRDFLQAAMDVGVGERRGIRQRDGSYRFRVPHAMEVGRLGYSRRPTNVATIVAFPRPSGTRHGADWYIVAAFPSK